MISLIPFKIPIFLFFTLIFLLIIRVLIKKGAKNYSKNIDDFLKREHNSNFIIKKFDDLDLEYVTINKDILPFKEYEDNPYNSQVIRFQNIVKEKLSLKMIRFENYLSNTELKELYGVNNFEKILLYESHFKGFIIALYNWANELNKVGNLSDAKKILIFAIDINADISRVFTLLADIYSKENSKESLEDLKYKVKNSSISTKTKTLEYIDKLL